MSLKALNGYTVIVPEGIEAIGDNAFADLYDMKYIKLPSTLKKVGNMAFFSCGNLQRMLVPASLTTIGKDAFIGSYFATPKDEDGDGVYTYGEVYYTGTEAQFKKIKSKIGAEFDYVTDYALITGITVTKEDGTVIKNGDKIEMNKIVAPVSETFTVQVAGGFDPITFEQAERGILLYIDDADVVESNDIFTDEETGITPVTLNAVGEGQTKVSIYSITDPSKKVEFTVVVKQRSTDVGVEYKGNYTTNDALILIPNSKKDTVIKPTIKWNNGSAWPADEYRFVALSRDYTPSVDSLEECIMELPEGIKVDPATGAITVAKDFDASTLSQREFDIMLVADSNPDDECECEVGTKIRVAVYDEKAPYVSFAVVNESYFDYADKIVLDPIEGKTECTLLVSPYNVVELNTGAATDPYHRYPEVEVTATENENFTFTDNEDGTVTVKLIGNTGSITITAKALDGSGKSAKMTVTAGTIVEEVNIVTTLPEVADNTYILAAGKTAILTADLNPAAPTHKALMWAVHPDYSEYLTVKNGTLTALKACPAPIAVGAYATDGSGKYDYINVLVTETVTGVDIGRMAVNGVDIIEGKSMTEEMSDMSIYFHFKAIPYALVNGEKDSNNVYSDVTWSVKGAIAKDVEMIPGDNGVMAFKVNKSGNFTVRAEALDGSKKYKEISITVKQQPTELELTTTGTTAQFKDKDGTDTWVFQGDLSKGITVKPKVGLYAKYKVDNKMMGYSLYLAEWEDGKVEDASAGGMLQVDAKGKPVKQLKLYSDEANKDYTLTVVSDANPTVKQTVYIQVRGKDYVPLEELKVEMPATVVLENNTVEVAAGSKIDIVEILNGSKVTKLNVNVHKGWFVEGTDTETSIVVTKGVKSQIVIPANAQTGVEHELELRYWNISSPDTYLSVPLKVKVVEKLNKANIGFVIAENKEAEGELLFEGTPIGELGAALNPYAGEFTFKVAANTDGTATTAYTVLSSKAAVLEVTQRDGVYVVTPKAPGNATLKITAMDGSKVVQSINVKVAAVKTPITNVVANSKAFTVDLNKAIVVDYSLKSTDNAPTIPVMSWESSDESVLVVEDQRIGEATVEKIDVKKGISYYTTDCSIKLVPQGKAGKATITGKTTDGSNKKVVLTVTVAKAATAYSVHISVPANAANGGEQGTVVVPWGKTLKLAATLMPNKAKNATVSYKVEAVGEKGSDNVVLSTAELGALGVTINNSGLLTVKAPTAKMPDPYTGWVKVTASLNYRDEYGVAISDSEYVYIDRPVDKINLTDVNSKKVSTITVSSADINGKQLAIDVLNEYNLTLTYKGYKTDTTAEAVYGRADNLLWTSSKASLATVDQNGVITVNEFTKAGTVKITAQAQDGSGAKLIINVVIKK